MQNDKQLVWNQKELDLEGVLLADMPAVIKNLMDEYGSEAYLDKEYLGHSGGYELVLKFQRVESDSEFKARLKREEQLEKQREKAEQKQREKERKEYERLKKKFEENKD